MAARFSNKALGVENETFEVEKSQICVERWILPEGTLWDEDEGECFAPYALKYTKTYPLDTQNDLGW